MPGAARGLHGPERRREWGDYHAAIAGGLMAADCLALPEDHGIAGAPGAIRTATA